VVVVEEPEVHDVGGAAATWSGIATCPINPQHHTAIVVTDGNVDASGLRYGQKSNDDSGEDE
jgi:hypothetical protein